MTRPFVYLAGPILGCTEGEAKDWRQYVAGKLAEHQITGISPLRCEPIIGKRYSMEYQDPKFGTAKAIATKNKFDVAKCDMVFAYLPIIMERDRLVGPGIAEPIEYEKQKRDSLGTLLEIGWASGPLAGSKPVIVVSDDPFIHQHPVLAACNGWCLPSLDDGLDVAIGLLEGYAGGKNV